MDAQIKLRRDQGSNWDISNPILAEGEVGIDLSLGLIKIGDGTTDWATLTYNGTSGTSGVNGTSGVGTAGADGTSGVDGLAGTSGGSGVDGTSGSSGVDGAAGTSGVDGAAGTSGSSGVDGAAGTSGVDGANGTSGSSGVDGAAGSAAIIGAQSGATGNFNSYPLTFLYEGTDLGGANQNGSWTTDGLGVYLRTAAGSNPFNTYTKQLYFGNAFYVNKAIGIGSTMLSAGGEGAQATGTYAAVIGGEENQANGGGTLATGSNNVANGGYSAAFGGYNQTNASYSLAAGLQNNAATEASFVTGRQNVTGGIHQTMVGYYGVTTGSTTPTDPLSPKFVVGCGVDNDNRFNALEVSASFTEVKNDLVVKDTVTGTRYKIQVISGVITATVV